MRISDWSSDVCSSDLVYKAASAHIFPVREIPGDPEGFGMVAVEAAAHGVPTIAFATGGIVDAVAEGESGRLIRPGDYGAFAGVVKIGRASCRERVCQYGSISVVAVSLKKKIKT